MTQRPKIDFETALAQARAAIERVGRGETERTVLITEGPRSYEAPDTPENRARAAAGRAARRR
jgi:hypothetical protein